MEVNDSSLHLHLVEMTGAMWEMGKDWTERGLGRIDGLVRRFGRRRGPRGLLGKIAAPFG